jgi:hypothetical protein
MMGNGGDIDVGETRGRDQKRLGADWCVPGPAAGLCGAGAQHVGAGAADPGRSGGLREAAARVGAVEAWAGDTAVGRAAIFDQSRCYYRS